MGQLFLRLGERRDRYAQAVEKFYADIVNYYGWEMTQAEVYQDKSYLIRRWPDRTCPVVPGSVSTSCSEDESRCQVTLVIDFQSESPSQKVTRVIMRRPLPKHGPRRMLQSAF